MKTLTPGKVNIDHVMWQPYNGCSRGCQGCYANKSVQDKGYGGSELLYLLYSKYPVITANQFTISLDCIKKVPDDLCNALIKLWVDVYKFEKGGPDREKCPLPHLCVTCKDLETLEFWAEQLDMSRREFLYPLSVLSLSDNIVNTDNLQTALDGANVILNRNLLVKTEVVEDPYNFSGLFDSVYVTLFKYPPGSYLHFDDMTCLINWCKVILKSDNAFCKVIPDACVLDALKWKYEGKACTAGIDKVHVWAKGAATGCPYDSQRKIHQIEGRRVHEDLFTEIENATTNARNSPIIECEIVKTLSLILDTEANYHEEKQLVKEVINKLGLNY